jgi:UDP:flavonoid glycosyltransferase YjiC (YdhE family)
MTVRILGVSMGDANHFESLRQVASSLVAAGAQVTVLTAPQFAPAVRAVGADFLDIFSFGTETDIDPVSRPLPVRFVSFAGHCAPDIARLVRPFAPQLIVSDSFAVIGRWLAARFDVPLVSIRSGHGVDPAAFRVALEKDDRLVFGEALAPAIDWLRKHGLPDAGPFSYVPDPSPDLNLFKEPLEWVPEARLAAETPSHCFGSLTALRPPVGAATRQRPRIYASFGTIVWRYWPHLASRFLATVATATQRLGVDLTVGLGNGQLAAEDRPPLEAAHVTVEPYVDQIATLEACDLFITHHGLQSTHEAVAARVPMLSMPFFWDQPALAATAERLGVAVPVAPGWLATNGQLDPAGVAARLSDILARQTDFQSRLATLRAAEARTIANRPAIAADIIGLVR